MSYPASPSYDDAASLTRPEREGGLRLDALQPLLAGAHARGMADALELAGVAAVLLDGHGMVLHVGAPAAALFGPDLRVDFDHLVGADGETTRTIQNLIAQTLGKGAMPAPLSLIRRHGAGLRLHPRRVPGAATDQAQLLKALIIIEEQAQNPATTGLS